MGQEAVSRTYYDLQDQPIANANKVKILDIAIDLFSRRGYTGVSVREITREVGIKESSLYNHFQSKDELLGTIFHNFRKDTAKILPPTDLLDGILASMTTEQFLERGIRNFMDHIADPVMEKIWRIVYIEQYRDPVAREILLQDIYGKTTDFLELVFAKLAALKRVKPIAPRLLAVEYQYPVFAMMTEYILLRFDGKDTGEVERRMSEHITFFTEHVSL